MGPEPIPVEIVAQGLDFPEGPVALPDGSVCVVEIGGRALTRIAADGRIDRVAQLDGGPNGAAVGPDGWVYVCNSGGWLYTDIEPAGGRRLRRPLAQAPTAGWIERVRLSDGRVEKLYADDGARALQSPNDLVFDADGGFYFTDLGKRDATRLGLGAVYYGHADGRPLRRVVGELLTPNGVGLSPDGATLYVAETITRRLLAFDIEGPGQVANHPWPAPAGGRVVAALEGFNALDSLAVDAKGWINVAALINGGIWAVSPDGSTRRHCPVDDPYTTNLCFGGPELRWVYVTMSASGRLGRLAWPVAGHRLNFNQVV